MPDWYGVPGIADDGHGALHPLPAAEHSANFLNEASAVEAGRAHNPVVVVSSPTPATKKPSRQDDYQSCPAFLHELDALKVSHILPDSITGMRLTFIT